MKRTFLLLSIISLTLGTSCAQNNNRQQQTVQTSNEQGTTARACFATLPDKVDFAGEALPMQYADVRAALEREMVAVMNMHSTTLLTLSRTTRYFPVIEPILKEYGIPDDFKYLAMTESSLNPNAASGAGARGMWQFMASAAKDYGVETGDNVDMRYNVEVATRAACRYLKSAYNRFGSWTLAAASYNLGMGGLNSRLNSQPEVKNYHDLFLPEETMRYVYHIVAYKIVTPNPEKYGFDLKPEDYLKPFTNVKTIVIDSENIDWPALAAEHGTNYRVLRILNPWIRSYSYKNPKRIRYTVTLPTGKFRELGY